MDPYDIATPNKPYYGMSIGPYYADEDDKEDEDLSIPEIKDISPQKQPTNLLAPILHMPIQNLTQSNLGTVRSHTPPPQSHISISDKTNFQLLQDEFKNLLQQTQQLVGLILGNEANVNNNNTPRTSSISDLSKSISQLSIRGYSEYILDNDDLARAKEKDQSAPPSPALHKLKTVDVPAQVKVQASELAEQLEEIKKRAENLQEDQVRGESIDWNKSFQEVLRLPDCDQQQRLFKFDKIREIARNFERTAEMFGKIIISEIFVPKKYKTIKPVTGLGGYAGGEKYIYNGILFKFAIDWKDIYGSDEFAMKAAGHELKGLMQVFTSNVTGISVPLMTLIDYLGFRLVAESILPINRTTIVYGSADAGITVHASRPEVNERMKQLGDKLHLTGHIVGRNKTNTHLLHTAGDMEGHLGYDGEFYLVDFARLMPPTPPVRNNRTSYLYQLFRPEFVKSYKVHLCSDSFSKLDEHDPDKARHEKQLRDAFKFMVEKLIPEFVRRLDSKFCKHNDGDLVDLVHQNGINLRYLSIVRALSQNSYLKMQLLLEMCARTIKCKLLEELRKTKKKKRVFALEPYHEVVLDIFNLILGNNDNLEKASGIFWNNIRDRMSRQFEGFPSDNLLLEEIESGSVDVALAIAHNCCTHSTASETYSWQLWFQCYTCGLVKDEGVCEVCAFKCHAGHNLSEARLSMFFCDCTHHCKAKNKENKLVSVDLDRAEKSPGSLLREIFRAFGFGRLFERIETIAGIKISTHAKAELKTNPNTFVFVMPDIEKLVCRTKQMTLVTFAEAHALHLQSLTRTGREKERLFEMSIKKFETSINSSPSHEVMNAYADALVQQAFERDPVDLKLLNSAIARYKNTKNIDALKEIVVRLYSKRDKLSHSKLFCDAMSDIFQKSCDIISRLSNYSNLNFIANYGEYLTELDLRYGLSIDGEMLTKLARGCTKLCSLKLSSIKLKEDSSIREFFTNCTSLSVVELAKLPITDETVGLMAQYCTNIQSLDLSACDELTNEISVLSSLKNLRLFVMRENHNLTDVSFLAHCTKLEHLDLGSCRMLNDASFTGLSDNCKKLRDLQLDYLIFITDLLLTPFFKHCRLRTVSLRGCQQITDVSLRILLERVEHLEYICVRNCPRVSQRVIRKFMAHDHVLADVQSSGDIMPEDEEEFMFE